MLNQHVCAASLTLALVTPCAVCAEPNKIPADGRAIEEIVVTAHPLSVEGLSQAADVLEGEELDRKRAGNIGATLAQQPGIHSAQFGNAVGRPVIHGLSGPRVKIMEDRIDTLDVSVTSGDHAVSIEPFVAERVEVLKGSSTLLYGAGAIGGVVDVHTGRIPHEMPQALTGGIDARYNSNTEGLISTAKINGGLGSFAWHLDATRKEGNDYEIPGNAISDRQQAIESQPSARGEVPGSRFDGGSVALGSSWIQSWGFVGFSYADTEADYGLPGEPDGIPTLELEQQRTDFELGIRDPFGPFSSFNLRVGAVDYEHQEIEPDGGIATTFTNDAWEGRAELVYEAGSNTGAFGLQFTDIEFSAIGEESFVPPVDSTETGLFWVGQHTFKTFDLELGARIGQVTHDPEVARDRRDNIYALSAGLVIPISQSWQLGLLADYASRAPVAGELYSNGPHLVTGTFELGNQDLDNEKATNLSATLQFDAGADWLATVTAYYNRFSGFIYQQANGDIEDGLPVVAFEQDDARFYGVDLEVSKTLFSSEQSEVSLRTQYDFVNARLDVRGNDNIPRTPPRRYGIGLAGQWRQIRANIDWMRVAAQREVALLELASNAYNDLTLHLSYEQKLAVGSFTLTLQGKNLTDDEQRIHTSFIKEVAPAPGRAIEAGVRWQF